MDKCECTETSNTPVEKEGLYSEAEKSGMNHKPEECKCTNDLNQYWRNGKLLWLCSCCHLPGDIKQ